MTPQVHRARFTCGGLTLAVLLCVGCGQTDGTVSTTPTVSPSAVESTDMGDQPGPDETPPMDAK